MFFETSSLCGPGRSTSNSNKRGGRIQHERKEPGFLVVVCLLHTKPNFVTSPLISKAKDHLCQSNISQKPKFSAKNLEEKNEKSR